LELKWVVVQEQISGTFRHIIWGGESYFHGALPASTMYSLKIDEDGNVIWTYSASDDYGTYDIRETSGHATCTGVELLISLQIPSAPQQFKAQVKDSGNVIEMEKTPDSGRMTLKRCS